MQKQKKYYSSYQEVPERYRFNLEPLLEGKTIDEQLAKIKKITDKLLELRDSQFDSKELFLEYKKHENKYSIAIAKLHNYISNKLSTNVVDTEMNRYDQKLSYQINEFYAKLGAVTNLFYKKIEIIKTWKDEPEVAIYKKEIEAGIEDYKHKLDDGVEDYLTKVAYGQISPYDSFAILSNSEVFFREPETQKEWDDFEKSQGKNRPLVYVVDSKGKKHILNDTTYVDLLKNKDEVLRKNAYQKYNFIYLKHAELFANLYLSHVKNLSADAKSRNFASLTESSIYHDRFKIELLEKLFKSVQKHSYLFERFTKLQAKFFKAKFGKKISRWDRLLELVNIKEFYSIEDAQDLVLKAVAPLGEEYYNQIKKAFADNWVDYHNVPNKRSGAYSIGSSYDIERKYILMNFDYTISSVDTLAHELGHSMHSYYSDKHQDFTNSQYPIILAEIASIFNELMLSDYLLSNSTSEEFSFYILTQMIRTFAATVYNQCLWAEYEHEVYKAVDSGSPIGGYDDFSKIYQDVLSRYESKPRTDIYRFNDYLRAVNVPHFYYGFYVYKYALGYIVANVFFQKYKSEGKKALDDYIKKFLSAGASKWPIELLKDAGVDLDDDRIYEQAFAVLKDQIDQYEKIGNQIFKNKK
ncbi:Oligoendopeptidase F, plasmid [Mesomycoplasma conjunctivae]|uniref:Oligopeptidase F n=1 Tax=Mesomycoplasma conjunctivae (strain ATCC 25834 / NCTC 10147 / HRC/581) TaxID=572263 RepID=C5J6N8_MESCH|nr:oligoendopeptidase F [Mesomycoplasma conjunctivae]CAT05146.1 Oligoendopeptidase F [Mesomycoplasma conjunctivae]VEU66159.1 Oligoendopeptidase F, plasmid [Mesomycoplasma conjunctivae]